MFSFGGVLSEGGPVYLCIVIGKAVLCVQLYILVPIARVFCTHSLYMRSTACVYVINSDALAMLSVCSEATCEPLHCEVL